jgi:DNA-binding transcriptional regulator YhcF (GntR family)
MEKSNLRTRERKGYNPKVHGGPGRPRKCLDETGTQAVSEVILVMSKADYTLSNRELSYSLGVSENTVKKYRKVYGQDAVIAHRTDPASVMAKADYSLSNKELVYSLRVCKPTVEKYRKIYAPETVKPPRPYVRKQK